jgi:hypothetical protein
MPAQNQVQAAPTYQTPATVQTPQQTTAVAPSPLSRLPTYTYDSKEDPAYVPYHVPEAHDVPPDNVPNANTLGTVSGLDVGLQVSSYKYREDSLDVTLDGTKFGITAAAAGKLDHGYFLAADIRYALGESDYSGSGTSSDNFENLWDIRGMFGRDFIFSRFSLSPYLGFGFRYLSSDDRGTSSTGFNGYRRENDLYYLPLGVKPRFRVTQDARIAATMEYDLLINGTQKSRLSDANPGLPDVTNNQGFGNGYGLRGDVMWEQNRWALGPFFNYWNIDESNIVCANGTVYVFCGDEPHNHTLELGIQFHYHFF